MMPVVRRQRANIERQVPPAAIAGQDEAWLDHLFAAARPFESRGLDASSRLIWHPLVQRQLGGRYCVFYRLRVHRISLAKVEGAIEGLVRVARVKTFTVFALLGDWDVLVRVWARLDEHERLKKTLNESPILQENVDDFVLDDLTYLWSPQKNDLTLRDISKARDLVVQAISDPPNQAALRHLHRDGLIVALPARKPERITYFVSLSPLPGHHFTQKFLTDLTTSLTQNGPIFATVMIGKGFTSCLIRFSASVFSEIFEMISTKISAVAEQHGAHSETYLPAHAPQVERDDLDLSGDLTPELRELAVLIGGDTIDRIRRCRDDQKHMMESNFKSYSHRLLSGPFEDVFLSLFSVLIHGPSDDLTSALVKLALVERQLRVFWRGSIEALEAAGAERSTGESAYEVGALKSALDSKSSQIQDVVPLIEVAALDLPWMVEPVRRVLGEDWATRLRLFGERLRQPVKDGTSWDEDYVTEFSTGWSEMSCLVCDMCVLYSHLASSEVGR